MKIEELILDESSGIYVPKISGTPTTYADGGEEYLERVLSNSKYLGLDSLELRDAINGWASLYHFSPYRPTIIDCFESVPKDARILELGAGCGGVTRWLGEKFSEVIAIEGSHKRASIAKSRCRDLDSVKVCGVNIYDLEVSEAFDIVTLIGVLEYSHLFHPNQMIAPREGAVSLLQFAYKALRPSGVLVLAIENKMGLKYFSGAGEDHSGKIFSSIHGYPDSNSAVTYSALELEELLRQAGFSAVDFYLPFPDYKLASTILNAQKIEKKYYVHNWIDTPFPDRTRAPRTLLFNEALAVRELMKAGLLKDMSNSFLILAYKKSEDSTSEPVIPRDQSWVACHYSLDRYPCFWKKTTLLLRPEGSPVVNSTPAFKSGKVLPYPASPFEHSFPGESYFQGELLLFSIFEMLERGCFKEEFPALLVKFNNFLTERFGLNRDAAHSGIPLLRGDALDITFWNVIVEKKTGDWQVIDKEWSFSEPLPADFVLCRNLLHLLARYQAYFLPHMEKKGSEEFVLNWMRQVYPRFATERLKMISEFEETFQGLAFSGKTVGKELLARIEKAGYRDSCPNCSDTKETRAAETSAISRTVSLSQKDHAENPLVSIIIPVFNNLNFTKNCLIALSQNTIYQPYEVVIIDNGSTDGTAQFLSCLEGDVQIIKNEKNLGFGKASNQGAKAANGEYLLFLNNDTLPTKGWLTELVKIATDNEHVGIVGSKLLYPDNTIQHAGVAFNKYGKVYHIYQGLPRDHPNVSKIREFQAVTGACMLIKKEIFMKVGGFDERFLNGFEDIDLCLKVKELGYQILYCPSSVVYHFESRTEGRKDHDIENSRVFSDKWRGKIAPDEEKIAREDGLRIIYNKTGNQAYLVYEIDSIKDLQVSGKHDIALRALEETRKVFEKCDKESESEYYSLLKELYLAYIQGEKLQSAKQILGELPEFAKKHSKYDDLKHLFSQYLKHQPLDFDVLQKYAEICADTGDFDEAIDAVEKILIFEPGRKDILNLKENLFTLQVKKKNRQIIEQHSCR